MKIYVGSSWMLLIYLYIDLMLSSSNNQAADTGARDINKVYSPGRVINELYTGSKWIRCFLIVKNFPITVYAMLMKQCLIMSILI